MNNTLKRYSIPYKGLSKGTHHYTFDVEDALFQEFANSEVKSGQGAATVELERSGSAITLNVSIRGTATVECDRCLDDLQLPVEFDGVLHVKFSEEVDEYDGDVMWLNPADDEIPLGQYIYESFILSLPYSKVHGEDSEGQPLCNPEMLAKFRSASPEEFDAMEIRSESLADNPEMAKLKELLNDSETESDKKR